MSSYEFHNTLKEKNTRQQQLHSLYRAIWSCCRIYTVRQFKNKTTCSVIPDKEVQHYRGFNQIQCFVKSYKRHWGLCNKRIPMISQHLRGVPDSSPCPFTCVWLVEPDIRLVVFSQELAGF